MTRAPRSQSDLDTCKIRVRDGVVVSSVRSAMVVMVELVEGLVMVVVVVSVHETVEMAW